MTNNFVPDDIEKSYLAADANASGNTDFEPLPWGRYQVKLEHVEPKTDKKGQNYLDLQFQIVSGPFKNRKIWKKDYLNNVTWLKSDLCKIGYAANQSLRELCNSKSLLSKFTGTVLEVSITPNKDGKTDQTGRVFANTNIVRWISTGEVDPEFVEVSTEGSDEQVPF